MVHLGGNSFAARKQKEVMVRAYSNCASVELRVNGRSLGLQPPDA
jgi:hypothetical protein